MTTATLTLCLKLAALHLAGGCNDVTAKGGAETVTFDTFNAEAPSLIVRCVADVCRRAVQTHADEYAIFPTRSGLFLLIHKDNPEETQGEFALWAGRL